MLGVVAGRGHVVVIAASVVEEHLALPRRGVTHVEAALHLGIETAVSKGAAPVLVNVESNHILFAVKFDESLLLIGQKNVFIIVPCVGVGNITVCRFIRTFKACALEDKFTIDVVLSGSVIVATSQIDRTSEQLLRVDGENTTNINVGYNAVACPLIGWTSVVCFISAEGSTLNFP